MSDRKPANANTPECVRFFSTWPPDVEKKARIAAERKNHPSKYDDWERKNPDAYRKIDQLLEDAKALPVGAERNATLDRWEAMGLEQHRRIRLDFFRDRQTSGEQPSLASKPRKDWDALTRPRETPREVKPLPDRSQDQDRDR